MVSQYFLPFVMPFTIATFKDIFIFVIFKCSCINSTMLFNKNYANYMTIISMIHHAIKLHKK